MRRIVQQTRHGTIVADRDKQIAAHPVLHRLDAKDHFEIGSVDRAENAQASFAAGNTDPLLAAVTDCRKQILDQGLGEAQAAPRDSDLNPVGWLDADKGRQVLEQRAAPQRNLDGRVRVAWYKKNWRNSLRARSFHGTWVRAGLKETNTGGFSPMRLRLKRAIELSITEPKLTCSIKASSLKI